MKFRSASRKVSTQARPSAGKWGGCGPFGAWLLLTVMLAPVAHAEDKTSVQIPALSSKLASKTLLTDSVQLSDRVVAVGSQGVIVYSTNGADWVQAKVPTQVLLTTVFFIDDREGWAAGHDTLILHTTDGGETWSIQYEDPITGGDLPKPILDIHFDDRMNGWAIGAFSLMLETRDGGKSWESVDTSELSDKLDGLGQEPEPNFNALYRMEDGFFIVGELGTLLHYRIGGAADAAVPADDSGDPADQAGPWRVFESPYEGSFFGVHRLKDGEVLIYGLRGHLFGAARLGDPWVKIDTGDSTANIDDVIELSTGEVIAVGSGGAMFRVDRAANRATLIAYGGFDGFISAQEAGPTRLLLFGNAGAKFFDLPQS